MADQWGDHRKTLYSIADDIADAEAQLQECYDTRSSAVLDAWQDGMPQREIGAELGVSHTMVQKIIAGELIFADSLRTSQGQQRGRGRSDGS